MENLQDTNKPVACRACNGSGRMVRDPDIGTDQECFACEGAGVFEDTTPPQRKPLTDEEIYTEARKHEKFAKDGREWFDRGSFARAIEAKLKEKNT